MLNVLLHATVLTSLRFLISEAFYDTTTMQTRKRPVTPSAFDLPRVWLIRKSTPYLDLGHDTTK
jgi:hypothetical protein